MSGLEGMSELQRRLQALSRGEVTRPTLQAFGLLAVQRSKELVPRRTGNLDRTIRVGEVDVNNARVTVLAGGRRNVGYAAAVEYGTRPHVIFPRKRKALAWGGARRLSGSLRSGARPTHFAKRVNHPGTRAKPYLRPGAQRALQEVGLANVVVKVWNEAA